MLTAQNFVILVLEVKSLKKINYSNDKWFCNKIMRVTNFFQIKSRKKTLKKSSA